MNEQPEPPTAVRTGVPMDLEKIVSKAMAKNAEERYQHLDELLVDLRREKKTAEQGESSQKIPARGKEYRKLSAIMFSDIVSYSEIMQQDEDLAMDLLTRHNQLIRDAIRKYDGKEIKVIGDAFLVDFETVVNAVRCAIEIQETVSRYNEDQPEDRRILLRIGIHVGDVVVKENDVFGDGVNIASRIEPLAEPGGICISQEVYNLVKHKLDVEVISLGPKELKNIKDKIEIYEILVGSIAGKELSASGSRIVARGKPIYKRPSALIGASIVLIGIVVGVYVFGSKSSEPRNQTATRVLRVPSNEAVDPNISPDGNWVVYVVPSANGSTVYIQAASGGEPKKIIGDTLPRGSPCFSTDATEILYDQLDGRDPTTGRWIHNIYKVSVLGGSPRKMINDGLQPIWSPDGKAIAFMRYGDNKMSVWLANPDGSAQKQVTTEKLGTEWTGYAWSPDSRSLGFIRDFEGYSELFVRDVGSSHEHQLTFGANDRKFDLCWAATDEIIFGSRQGININLWTIPADGGTPKQLTFELGRTLNPHVSKDAKRLIYIINSSSFNLWTADLETKQSRQLSFDEGIVMDPVFSPRGDKLLYRWFHGSGELFVSNVDGSEPTKIPLPGWPRAARWSGDGKAVAYSVQVRDTVLAKPDSVHHVTYIFIHDLDKEAAQKIGKGILVDWSSDGKYMLLQQENSPANQNTYILAPTKSLDKPIKEIKSVIEPSFTHDSKNVLCADSTRLWSMPVESGQRSVICSLPKGLSWVREVPDGQSIGVGLRSPVNERVWTYLKISKSGKKLEKLFEAAGVIWGGSYSPDMKTCVFTKADIRNKIVVIDNFR